ncbi:NADP-dependent malic enzyme [Salmonella enterica subsp. enterica serovar Senftenberg str. A4-543]|uniref:NADP-dependent malic enzyme n=1 Tax=Salmonella enterica subsp. enterica serovar Senftenberg str. A4-543 TaxID=913082 RepID=G5R3F5_SALSE|nr:NADP-dependent malic enzyme [Salmonella enterica subsp. enterica serovar Senftenberg str. A4-543]
MDEQLKQSALDFHEFPVPGKIQVSPTKPLATQRDLALAYSPGVAAPCLEIEKDPLAAYKYTARGAGSLQIHRAHRARQPCRGHFQRYSGTGVRQHWRAGRQAGHGRQRRSV